MAARNLLVIGDTPLQPKLNRKRALFVMATIDEILACEQRKEKGAERGHPVRGAGEIFVGGAGGAILAAGKTEVFG